MVEANSTYTSPYPQQWLFSPAHLQATPSSEDNTIPLELELEDRRRGVDLIRRLCERLPSMDPSQVQEVKAMQPNWTVADARHWALTHEEYQSMPHASHVQYAAATFLHRFYMRFALQDFPIKLIAPTCLYLALKTEEMTKIKARTLAQSMKWELGYDRVESRMFVGELVTNEEYLLEALCYDLAVEHPQAILLQAHRTLQYTRRKNTARNIIGSTPTTEGGRTPASGLGGKTPGSTLGAKTPGSALGSVMDMDMDSPLPKHASFIGDKPLNGGRKEGGEFDESANLSEDEAEEVLLDLATEILMATFTTPLTVLSKPYVIAASAYILAISMVKQQTIHDSLRGLDLGVWEDAFLPQDGIKPTRGREGFEADIRDCCAMILEFHRRGLIQKEVLDDDMDVAPHYMDTDGTAVLETPEVATAETPPMPNVEETMASGMTTDRNGHDRKDATNGSVPVQDGNDIPIEISEAKPAPDVAAGQHAFEAVKEEAVVPLV